MSYRNVFITAFVSLAVGLAGFVFGFRQGADASILSEFVLRGVIASQRLTALEKDNQEFLYKSLRSDIDAAFSAREELEHFKHYQLITPVTDIELHGLESKYIDRLKPYQRRAAENPGDDYHIYYAKTSSGEIVYGLQCKNGTIECNYKWESLCKTGKAMNADPVGKVTGTPFYTKDKDMKNPPMRFFVCE